MDLKKNEQGYALIIVLFLIVFTMAVFAVFMRGSISNAKQEKIVDQNHLSVVAAEMGVDYYKTATINTFNIKKEELIEQAQEQVNALVQSEAYTEMSPGEIKQSLEAIRRGLVISLENHLEEEVPKFRSPHPISSTVKFDNLSSPTVLSLGYGVKVSGVITGHSEGYSKDLDFDITFDVPELTLGELGGGTGNSGALNMHKLYPDDSNLPICSDKPVEGKACKDVNNKITLQEIDKKTDVYFPNVHVGSNPNNQDYKGSNLYFKNGLTINNNMNNTKKVNLFIDGPFHVGNINGSNGLLNSKIIVNGNMTTGQLLITNSTIMIRGALRVGDHLTLNRNSKICIAGSITTDKKFDISSSEVYVWGTASGSAIGKVRQLGSEVELWSICGGDLSTPGAVEMDWDENHEMNVAY